MIHVLRRLNSIQTALHRLGVFHRDEQRHRCVCSKHGNINLVCLGDKCKHWPSVFHQQTKTWSWCVSLLDVDIVLVCPRVCHPSDYRLAMPHQQSLFLFISLSLSLILVSSINLFFLCLVLSSDVVNLEQISTILLNSKSLCRRVCKSKWEVNVNLDACCCFPATSY